jgi:hypothetical protein
VCPLGDGDKHSLANVTSRSAPLLGALSLKVCLQSLLYGVGKLHSRRLALAAQAVA